MKYMNIEAERARRRMSKKEFSKKIGIHPRTYCKYQRCGGIPANKLIEMANLFECSADYLLGRKTA